MSQNTKIEWASDTWNCVRGCSTVSEGCRRCYAMAVAARFSGPGLAYEGLAKRTEAGPRWTGVVRLVREHLAKPLGWKKPRRIFVNSMSDLFHEKLPFHAIDQVFDVMIRCPQHVFMVLTKRAERMVEYFASTGNRAEYLAKHPGIWMGVSVEDQRTAEERLPHLRRVPAGVRFVSCEPLLGPLHSAWIGISWLILGGESGHGARPCRIDWIRSIVAQCKTARVSTFVKQLGAHVIDRNDAGFDGSLPTRWPEGTETDDWDLDPGRQYQGADARIMLASRKGGDMAEWPEDLRIRDFPKPLAALALRP
jgi:protein gp37